ncbi:MAG: hypothetical protein ACEPOV_04070 [Hyphomicrobiales bacterium]
MKTLAPLNHYYFKYVGLIGLVISIGLYFFIGNHFDILVYFSLLLIIISKSKNETKQIQNIRNDAFKLSFIYSITIAFGIFYSKRFIDKPIEYPEFIIIKTMILTHFVYFYGCRIIKFTPDPNAGVKENHENIKHSAFFAIIILAISAVAFCSVLFFQSH